MLEILKTIYSQFWFPILFWGPLALAVFYSVIKGQHERIAKAREVESIKRADEAKFLFDAKQQFIKWVDKNFHSSETNSDLSGMAKKREWYASVIADLDALDATVAGAFLRAKKRPAFAKAREIEGPIKEKLRQLRLENKKLELELQIFDELFPDYAPLREHILESEDTIFETSIEGDKSDRARLFLSPQEYSNLKPVEREQLALTNYCNRNHSKQEIGKMYERYLGYLWEKKGWDVQFKGIVDGKEDLGRDLICKKKDKVEIIQAKNWSAQKLIHEKHIYQLFATKTHFCLENAGKNYQPNNVQAVFASTTDLSDMAKNVAEFLKVRVVKIPLSKEYPMIKCNINPASNTQIYHLPFDQQYDKIKVGDQKGEQYVATVKEAKKLGFRRAFRWRPDKQ